MNEFGAYPEPVVPVRSSPSHWVCVWMWTLMVSFDAKTPRHNWSFGGRLALKVCLVDAEQKDLNMSLDSLDVFRCYDVLLGWYFMVTPSQRWSKYNYNRIFHYEPSSYWVIPIYGNPQLRAASWWGHCNQCRDPSHCSTVKHGLDVSYVMGIPPIIQSSWMTTTTGWWFWNMFYFSIDWE